MAGPGVVAAVEAVRLDRGLVTLERRERERAALADPACLGAVREDAEDPRLQRRALLEAVDPLDDREPRLGRDLLRNRLRGDVHPRDPDEHRVVHLDELAEGRFLAVPQRRDQGVLVVHVTESAAYETVRA